jgi:methionyl-tRNA formyltransferase
MSTASDTSKPIQARVVFMGTPAFSVASLELLIAEGYAIIGVYTGSDKAVGRHKKPLPSPVKQVARKHDIPVFHPASFREPQTIQQLRELKPDVIIVVSYGRILPKIVLDIPVYGAINVHASLLPEYRGASPIHGALRDGKTVTGITIMEMDEGMDTGNIIATREVRIEVKDTFQTLHDKLAGTGAALLVSTLPAWLRKEITSTPQDHDKATTTSILTKEDGRIDWHLPAEKINNHIRAYSLWPKSYTFINTGDEQQPAWKRMNMISAEVIHNGEHNNEEHGKIESRGEDGIAIICANGALLINTVQLEGKRPISGKEFARGYEKLIGRVCRSQSPIK